MVITFLSLGTYGRLGNQLFEVAALLGLSKKVGATPAIPTKWPYRDKFNIPEKYYADVVPTVRIVEKFHHYDPNVLSKAKETDIVDLVGCFQSEKYFEEISEDIKIWLFPKGSQLNTKDDSVGVHVRRGDYVGNPNYTQLDEKYYRTVMDKYFSDEKYEFHIVSDDKDFIEKHLRGPRTTLYKQGDEISDLRTLALCKNHILSPSSFSWWGTYLSRAKGINIRPKRTHVGRLSHLNENDMWQRDWIIEDVSHLSGQKVKLVCYADDKYSEYQKRLVDRAAEYGKFDQIIAYKRKDLVATDFYKSNKDLLDLDRGGGYWVWKPYFILDTLNKMEEDDILLYMDCGDLFFGDIRTELERILNKDEIVLTDGGNRNAMYTKPYCFVAMDCNSRVFKEARQVEAGTICMRNTPKTRNFIKEWLKWCLVPGVVTDLPVGEDGFEFIDHRHDQSILTNLAILYSIPCKIDIRSYVICNMDLVDNKDDTQFDLTDFTFVIPVRYDHKDREENLKLVIAYLQKWFKTNIIIGEQGPKYKFSELTDIGVKYITFEDGDFHRTKFINDMVKLSDTEFVFNWDADVIIDHIQIYQCALKLRSREYDFVYPYGGAFLQVPRIWVPMLWATLNTSIFSKAVFKGMNDQSVGGAVGFNKIAFYRAGMENENYVSHAPEDVDRYLRFDRFGRIFRIPGPLYHIQHYMGVDSKHRNDYFVINNSEIRKIKKLEWDELCQYMQTWAWIPEEYRPKISISKKQSSAPVSSMGISTMIFRPILRLSAFIRMLINRYFGRSQNWLD